MARVVEQIVSVKFSRLVKDSTEVVDFIVDEEVVEGLTALVEQLVEDNRVIVEVENQGLL